MQVRKPTRRAKIHIRVPRLLTSSVEAGPQRDHPVLDGSDVIARNTWNVAPNTIVLVGRPAVWIALDIRTPNVVLGPLKIPARRLSWEQDFGGHLFLAIAGDDAAHVTLIESGPRYPNHSGGLVPFRYPEDRFAKRGFIDFDPIVIEPPHGLDRNFFHALVARTQRDYDGDQRYLVIEIPFLRVGRDSNSYIVGILLACGVDPRAVPKPHDRLHFEITGYPGVEDPVHAANFGVYLGRPQQLADGAMALPFHDADGSVRFVAIGGTPNGSARTPAGEVTLDPLGRCVLALQSARRHGLSVNELAPPAQICDRRRFPNRPAPAGALITLNVAGRAVPLRPGNVYRGTVVSRNDALGLAILQGAPGQIVLPLAELGAELRDPKRVNRLLQLGNEVTLGLHRDRRPRLVAHGRAAQADALHPRRAHAPQPVTLALGVATVIVAAVATFVVARRA